MYFISFIALFISCLLFLNKQNRIKEIPYSQLLIMIKNKEISEIEVQKKNINVITKKNETFICAADNTEQLKNVVENFNNDNNNVDKIKLIYKSPILSDLFIQWIFNNFLFFCFLLFLLYLIISSKFSNNEYGFIQQVLVSETKKTKKDDIQKVSLDDVGGCKEAKRTLKEVVDFLKNKELYDKIGATRPRGILLYGPPGTGKTMLAKAVANEADCEFIYSSASEFDEMFVGVGASRVRELFAKAKKKKNCVIFIDELDALGSRRDKINGYSSQTQTLNELLTQMDGFDSNNNVLVIGATNMLDSLDQALIRSGRFDKKIEVAMPMISERVDILERIINRKKIKLDQSINLYDLALMLQGMSGADIAVVLNTAAMQAVRERSEFVSFNNIDYAVDIIHLGEIKDLNMTEKEKIATARHEAGHALIAYRFPSLYDIYKTTIIPRSKSLGMLQRIMKDKKFSSYKIEYINEIKCLLAGKASEEIYYGDHNVSSGACNDLNVATYQARQMIEQFGMLGSLMNDHNKNYTSEEYKAKCDKEIDNLLNKLYQETKDFLKNNKKALDHLSDELYKKGTLLAKEIESILDLYNIKNENVPELN